MPFILPDALTEDRKRRSSLISCRSAPSLVSYLRCVRYRRSPGDLDSRRLAQSAGVVCRCAQCWWSASRPWLMAAAPVHQGCAQADDCQNDPDPDHPPVEARVPIPIIDHGHEAGNPSADP